MAGSGLGVIYFSCKREEYRRANPCPCRPYSSGRKKATSLPLILPRATVPLNAGYSFTGLFFLGKKVHRGKENRKGNCFEFALIPGKYMSSENRCTTQFSCPAPFCSKAGAKPGKKGRLPRSRSSRGKGSGITQQQPLELLHILMNGLNKMQCLSNCFSV